MPSPTQPLLSIARSRTQVDMLALLFLHPEREYTLTSVARRIGVSVKSVSVEADRLVASEFIADRRIGPARLIRAKTDTIIARPLTDLLAVTYGPLPVLTELLSGTPDVEQAFIYGSWAARYSGEAGPIPEDVDVLVVGDADRDELYELAGRAEEVLGRPVNIRRVRSDVWHDRARDTGFIRTVRERPLVELRIHGEQEAPS